MIELFSRKQLQVLHWWLPNSGHAQHCAIICDGAVRSGKTLCMALSFFSWSFFAFSNQRFALCGKTIAALRRNVIDPLRPHLASFGFAVQENLSRNWLDVRFGGQCNRYYLFGGKDESSAAMIQGMTLAGVLLDEVALMPRSFVEQALARCSVEGSRFWFNCNPDYPQHWFHQEWILLAEQKNAFYLHFLMTDNPALSAAMRARYQGLYSGAFYKRFVEGMWVGIDGLVYPMFDPAVHVAAPPASCDEYVISCDYGTVNPSSFGLWGKHQNVWVRLREYYWDSRQTGQQRTDEEHYAALAALAGELPIAAVVCDPSAASFLECIRRHGRFALLPAKNDVLTGIRLVADALRQNTIRFAPTCTAILNEFALYCWEPGGRDAPRKEHDHAMDDMRYFVASKLVPLPQDDWFVCGAPR